MDNLDNYELEVKNLIYYTQYLHIIHFDCIKTHCITYKARRERKDPNRHLQFFLCITFYSNISLEWNKNLKIESTYLLYA